MKIPVVKLNNGVEIPSIGLGSYSLVENDIFRAISVGYRHIDTAKHYQNEDEVGRAIKKSGIDRKDFFVTTKIMRPDLREKRARESFDSSLFQLDMDYVDLYLIHFPPKAIIEDSWRDMERLYESGKIRAIGVSNYDVNDLKIIMKDYKVKPTVNQICSHPYMKNEEIISYCKDNNIQIEAYSPLGGNSVSKEILADQTLSKIAKKYELTVSQLILRWNFQRGVISIPRSTKENHLKQNLEIFSIGLSEEDMVAINIIEEERIH